MFANTFTDDEKTELKQILGPSPWEDGHSSWKKGIQQNWEILPDGSINDFRGRQVLPPGEIPPQENTISRRPSSIAYLADSTGHVIR